MADVAPLESVEDIQKRIDDYTSNIPPPPPPDASGGEMPGTDTSSPQAQAQSYVAPDTTTPQTDTAGVETPTPASTGRYTPFMQSEGIGQYAHTVQTYDQWVAAGGAPDWNLYRAHARAIGMPDPGDAPPANAPKPATTTPASAPTPQPAPAPPRPAPAPQTTATTATTPTTPPPGSQVQKPVTPGGQAAVRQPQPSSSAATPTTAAGTTTVWIMPDGSIQQPTPGQVAKNGTVVAQVTPEQLAGLQRRTPTTTSGAPIDPGAALAKPSEGQLSVDARPVPIASSLLGGFVNNRPIDAVIGINIHRMSGGIQSPPEIQAQIVASQVKGVSQAIGTGAPGSMPMLDDIARLAWYRQVNGMQNGQPVTPEMAPRDYIESWKGAWRTGRLVPLGAALDQQLIDNGMEPPSSKSAVNKVMIPNEGTNPQALNAIGTGVAKGMAVTRRAQGDPNEYKDFTPQEFAAWKGAACGAASFAAMVNAADPSRDMTVGEALRFLMRKNLISQSDGLLRGQDFSDIQAALDEAISNGKTDPNGKPIDYTYAVNYRSPDAVKDHFAKGGGAIMFTGPSTAVWGMPHIYVVTGADGDGVNIVDSSGANKTRLTWDQYMRQTGMPGMGAGAALRTTAGQGGTNTGGLPIEAQQVQGGSVASTAVGQGGARPSEHARAVGKPSEGDQGALGGKGEAYTEPEVRSLQSDIMTQAPEPQITPGMSVEDRARAWLPTLQWLQQRTGMDPSVVMGLMYNENAIGDSNLTRTGNNYFSMEYSPNDRFSTGRDSSGRWAMYDSPKAAFARFIGVLSHPENTYNTKATLWKDRADPEATLRNMIKGGYIVDEPGFPISDFVNGVHSGMNLYRRITGQ